MSDNVVRFPQPSSDCELDRRSCEDKLRRIGECQIVLAAALKQMRQLGADDELIVKILKHAATVIDGPQIA